MRIVEIVTHITPTAFDCGMRDAPCWTGVLIALSNLQVAAAVCVVSMHCVAYWLQPWSKSYSLYVMAMLASVMFHCYHLPIIIQVILTNFVIHWAFFLTLIHAGGVLTTRLNDVSLDSFAAVGQDDLLEASGFAKRLLASTFLPALLQASSCTLEVDVTDSRNEMEFIFRDTEMTNRESAGRMCHDIANILECLMNNRTRPTRDNCNVDTDIIDSIPANYTVQEEDPTLSAVTVATSSPVSDLSTGATQGIAITLATVCIAVLTALCAVW